eukprot:Protomagalhaensia_sp_Gyna_25__3898@NODE_34_length_6868_cov_319_110265_g24_i0_p4_GENE_NODE_34_length_6868_cov_319_110265_g24_i0NODE_34_length_6868_cov_319_110265_g24_i0_p4_ORF_typecomplete_len300_score3_44TPR_2/PF07719_17/0_053TPR_2/PF07719_17/0_33TPR_16/PF13432_6/0_00046TPR_15/PF13429_6/2_7TPR_15/PF13429_6/0_53TPR_1/PF00515_28/0_23TPR_1/PF00515_28/9_6DUF3856/PF12968_7/0_027DUF3856/PF12968_7/2_7e02TPR_MalT/PF17874_1/0_013ANAPC3/PF12895_7/0_3ANAPC3/PF12895_7/0_5TPR_9/PF13371_6/4_5TPR_9/PF13371_6/0
MFSSSVPPHKSFCSLTGELLPLASKGSLTSAAQAERTLLSPPFDREPITDCGRETRCSSQSSGTTCTSGLCATTPCNGPCNGLSYVRRSQAYHALGHYSLALVDARKALEVGGKECCDWKVKGRCHAVLGEWLQALEAFTRGLKADARSNECKEGLLHVLGRDPVALEVAVNALVEYWSTASERAEAQIIQYEQLSRSSAMQTNRFKDQLSISESGSALSGSSFTQYCSCLASGTASQLCQWCGIMGTQAKMLSVRDCVPKFSAFLDDCVGLAIYEAVGIFGRLQWPFPRLSAKPDTRR